MKARVAEDRMAFYLSIQRVAPAVWADLGALSAKRKAEGSEVSRADVAAFLERWHLDSSCRWLSDDVLCEAHSQWVGVPSSGGGILTHDMPPVVLAWEPGDSGEDRAAFVKRAREAIDIYADRVEAWRKEKDIEIPRRERERGEVESGPARWDLLVSRLVLRETYETISRSFGITRQGAQKHAEALAARLGVHLP